MMSIIRCLSLLLCCWKRVFAMTSAFSWKNLVLKSCYTIVSTWEKPRCPVTDECMKKMWYINTMELPVQFSSVAQSCLTLCDPLNCSTPGLSVHHELPEFTQTHVYRVGEAIQQSHPLSSPSPPAPNSPQYQGLFQ